jgi:oligopeptide/dipeptide ABC transporter ATP-binding protein
VPRVDEARRGRLVSISGLPPDLVRMPPGCKFHPRCAFREDRCMEEEPPLGEVGPSQVARCWVLMRNVPHEAAKELEAPVVSHEVARELQETAPDLQEAADGA